MMAPTPHLPQKPQWITFLLGAIPVMAVYLSYLLLGKDAHFEILDNLEAEPLFRDMLRRDLFTSPGDGIVQQTQNGLPRVCLPGDLNLTTWIHFLLPPFAAYMTNLACVMLVAYAGTWLLLRRSILAQAPAWMSAGVAACYSVLPVYPEYGISVAGLPLLLLGLLWVNDRRHRWASIGIILLFLLWSSFYLVGFFVLAALGLAWVVVCIRTRRLHVPLLLAVVGMGFGYLIVEHRLMLESLVLHSFVPHRVEFAPIPTTSFRNSIGSSLTYLLDGFYHAPTLSRWLLFPLFIVSGFGLLQWLRRRADAPLKSVALLGMCIAFICVLTGFTHWTPLEKFFGSISFFQQFNRERLYFLLPLCWYVLLALGCMILWRNKYLRYAAPLLITLQGLYILAHHVDFGVNVRRLQAGVEPTVRDEVNTYSWRTFYAEEIMQQVEDHIGQPMDSYKVVGIGIKPALTLHHGFHTLDFYGNYYPLAYKQQFRRIMAAELSKSEFNQKYFDEWGNRCMILTAETGDTLHHLALDMEALRQLGGTYLLSHPYISNADSLGLTLERKWVQGEYPDKVHLYKVGVSPRP